MTLLWLSAGNEDVNKTYSGFMRAVKKSSSAFCGETVQASGSVGDRCFAGQETREVERSNGYYSQKVLDYGQNKSGFFKGHFRTMVVVISISHEALRP